MVQHFMSKYTLGSVKFAFTSRSQLKWPATSPKFTDHPRLGAKPLKIRDKPWREACLCYLSVHSELVASLPTVRAVEPGKTILTRSGFPHSARVTRGYEAKGQLLRPFKHQSQQMAISMYMQVGPKLASRLFCCQTLCWVCCHASISGLLQHQQVTWPTKGREGKILLVALSTGLIPLLHFLRRDS